MKRIVRAVVISAVPLLLAAGCGGAQPVAQPSSGNPGESVTTPAPTSVPPTRRTSAPTPTYPVDYHGAVLAAWARRDGTRLALLTSDPQDFLDIAGRPDQHWTKVRCEGAMGSEYCAYENRTGDVIVIRVGREGYDLHKWHVATLHTWDPMTFPNDPAAYADLFVQSWIDGHAIRMLRLSTGPVVDHFKALKLIDKSYTIETDGAAGHTYARITNGGGFNQTISIVNDKVAQRMAHAIDGFR